MSRLTARTRLPARRLARGMSLVELMVSLVLGLLVAGSAIAIFLSNRQTYAASESLGRIQENSRAAYELMVRDIREAGGNGCAKRVPVANVLNNAGAAWWSPAAWIGLQGYENGALAGSVATTDAIEVIASDDQPVVVSAHSPAAGTITFNTATTGLRTSDVVMMCDYRQASIFQLSNVAGNTATYGTAGAPGNCNKDLTFPVNCGSLQPGITYPDSSLVARLHAVRWFIGATPGGGRSLFQTQMRNVAGVMTPVAQEIVEGVTDLQLEYLESGETAYGDATTVTNWLNVLAVRVSLTMEGGEGQGNVGTNAVPGSTAGSRALVRRLQHVVTIRNHAQ